MKKHCKRNVSLKSQEFQKCINDSSLIFSPYCSVKNITVNYHKSQDLTFQQNLGKKTAEAMRRSQVFMKDFLQKSFESKLNSKVSYLSNKLKESLKNISDNNNFHKEFEVYCDIINELSDFIIPFDNLLKSLLTKIQNIWLKHTENGKFTQKIKDLEDSNQKMTEEIMKLNTEKQSLIKKLNKCSEDMIKNNQEKKFLQDMLKISEKKLQKLNNITINSENMIDSMFKQYETIEDQKTHIQSLLKQENQYKKMLELIGIQFPGLDKRIKEVKKQFE
jgi:chromosome segregation ATPase